MTRRCCPLGTGDSAGAPGALDPADRSSDACPPMRGSGCGDVDPSDEGENPDIAAEDPTESGGSILDGDGVERDSDAPGTPPIPRRI